MFLFHLMNIANAYCFFLIKTKWVNGIIDANDIFSFFDGRVDVILITNKNKTSYDALSVIVLFISSARISNMFLLADLVFSDKLSLFRVESSVNVNMFFISL